jgi:hypothetical protein
MALSFVAVLGFLLLFEPLFLVSCTKYLRGEAQAMGKHVEGDYGHGSDDFAKWVERVGQKHRLQQQVKAMRGKNGGELVGEDPSFAPPDLSAMFPGLKQYSDWGSVVAPGTYIVVDQNGFGDFKGIWEAIDSIPNDPLRRYRITIQVNAGTYR